MVLIKKIITQKNVIVNRTKKDIMSILTYILKLFFVDFFGKICYNNLVSANATRNFQVKSIALRVNLINSIG